VVSAVPSFYTLKAAGGMLKIQQVAALPQLEEVQEDASELGYIYLGTI